MRKSVDKRATVRNRARRVARSCIEQSIKNIVPGLDMLFLLEKGIIEKKQQEIKDDIHLLLKSRNLLQ